MKNKMKPQIRLLETPDGGALLCGFNLKKVGETACILFANGFVPVEEEYLLYEHKRTKVRGHFRRITFKKS